MARAVLMGDDEAITSPPGIGALPDDVREQWHAESFTLDWEAEDFGWGRIELERQMEFVGLADRIGAVKPGYFADLLVVRGDPVSSITATRSVALVIKSGRIVFAEDPSLPQPGF